jgi:hypothetical protein
MPAKKKPPVEIDLKFPETFRIAWDYWKNFKKEQFRFTYKPIGEQAALEGLFEMAGGSEETAKAIIKQSIKNGWRGLFELKDNHGTTANRPNNGAPKPGTSTARVDALKDWGIK